MKDFGKKLSSTKKLGIDTIFSSGANDTGTSADNVETHLSFMRERDWKKWKKVF